jgi:arginyl-tRNA synthetase
MKSSAQASLSVQVAQRLQTEIAAVTGLAPTAVDPVIRPSDHAHLQANGVLALSKRLHLDPRSVAAEVADRFSSDDLMRVSVSGPGFLNITLTDAALTGRLPSVVSTFSPEPEGDGAPCVIDYSQPNIAKEMHVGHLRSTIIGDAIVRVLEFGGQRVIRQNHIGDWGTQFGMMIEYQIEHDLLEPVDGDDIGELNRMYQAARKEFDSDPAFADRARLRVVKLQAGDPETLAKWEALVAISKRYFGEIYDLLEVKLEPQDAVGESFYNPMLPEIARDLEDRGIAVRSDGALCVFLKDVVGGRFADTPLIIQKSDGGFGYAATDIAAIRYRVGTLGAKRIIYVVDARQSLHFKMVFAAARLAGYLPDDVEAVHVSFGSVLGLDGKPLKTRAGESVPLRELLLQAIDRAAATLRERSADLSEGELQERARELGVGAVKYADLSTNRNRDYVFDLDRMVSLQGNTSVYLQYAHARVRSILRRAGMAAVASPTGLGTLLSEPERWLALELDRFTETVAAVADELEPHRLCLYLFSLAQRFSDFYEHCPVLNAEHPQERERRLLFCLATGEALRVGLALLGIAAPDRL